MPEVPAVPHRKGSLTLALTHRFRRRGIFFGIQEHGQQRADDTIRDRPPPPSGHPIFRQSRAAARFSTVPHVGYYGLPVVLPSSTTGFSRNRPLPASRRFSPQLTSPRHKIFNVHWIDLVYCPINNLHNSIFRFTLRNGHRAPQNSAYLNRRRAHSAEKPGSLPHSPARLGRPRQGGVGVCRGREQLADRHEASLVQRHGWQVAATFFAIPAARPV